MFTAFFQALFNRRGTRTVNGQIVTTTSGAITSGATGKGWTASKAGTGLYDLVVAGPVNELIAVHLTPLFASAADHDVQVVGWTAATKTLRIMTKTGASAADIAALGIHFSIIYKASTAP